jgi:septum formation protein
MADPAYRVVLASASPARLATLRRTGVDAEAMVSGVDETGVDAAGTAELTLLLATAKCRAVASRLDPPGRQTIVIGCDSLLELDGGALGKPADADDARGRWRAMRGRTGSLVTGHCVRLLGADGVREASAVAATVVRFAELTDAEVDAYVATGEPLGVAGAFTIDGLGAPFVSGVDGDPHNVVGISLPLLRQLLAGLGVRWTDLWSL